MLNSDISQPVTYLWTIFNGTVGLRLGFRLAESFHKLPCSSSGRMLFNRSDFMTLTFSLSLSLLSLAPLLPSLLLTSLRTYGSISQIRVVVESSMHEDALPRVLMQVETVMGPLLSLVPVSFDASLR